MDNDKTFSSEFEKIAYTTAPNSFRDVVRLPKNWEFEHNIDTGDAVAVKVHGLQYSPPEHLLIDQFVKDGLSEGIIQPRKSPWLAPIILVKKAEGSSRVCVDYRK